MEKSNGFSYLATACLLLWAGLLGLTIFKMLDPKLISSLTSKMELIFNFATFFVVLSIYKHHHVKEEKIFFFLLIVSMGLLLNDAAFYLYVYFPANYLINMPALSFTIDMLTYAIWVIACILFLFKLAQQNFIRRGQSLKTVIGLILFNLIAIYYISSIQYAYGAASWQSILQIISTIAELLIVDMALLCLVYSKNSGLSSILVGLIVLVLGDSVINYSYVTQTNNVEVYGELLWFLGLLFILFGAILLKRDKVYKVSDWFKRTNTMKTGALI